MGATWAGTVQAPKQLSFSISTYRRLVMYITSYAMCRSRSRSGFRVERLLLATLDALEEASVGRLLLEVLVPKESSTLARENTGDPRESIAGRI